MNATTLLLLLIMGMFGIASAGCLIWADELDGVCEEIRRAAYKAWRRL